MFLVVVAVVMVGAVSLRQVQAGLASRSVINRLTPVSSFGFSWPRISLPTSQAKYEKSLPVVLDSIARSLHSGSGFVQALRECALLDTLASADICRVLHEVDLGVGAEDALAHWSQRSEYSSVRLTVAAMTLALETGADQARAIDSASAAVRRTLEAVEIARTHSTQARASALMVGAMPWLVAIPASFWNQTSRHFMFGTVYGWACIAAGVVLDAFGFLWMHALAKRALS